MKLERLDHLVLTVRDLSATCSFYVQVLGMEEISFSGGRKAVRFGNQKINLHLQGQELAPKALHPVPGSADLCFLTATPLEEVIAHFEACGVPILAGPVERTGTMGPIVSAYLRDPDGNLIEVSNPASPPTREIPDQSPL